MQADAVLVNDMKIAVDRAHETLSPLRDQRDQIEAKAARLALDVVHDSLCRTPAAYKVAGGAGSLPCQHTPSVHDLDDVDGCFRQLCPLMQQRQHFLAIFEIFGEVGT